MLIWRADDQCYGMIRWKQEGMGLQDYGLGLVNPDFMKLADAYGAKGHRVQSADDLARILKECQAEKVGGVTWFLEPRRCAVSVRWLSCWISAALE